MRIIISPAKKMKADRDTCHISGMPCFLSDARKIMEEIKKLSFSEAQALWKCNEKLTELNVHRFQDMDLEKGLTPAVLAYEGLQYQHMAPEVFTENALSYVEENLRILSGFYGILNPFDGVTPYRLEMQAKLSIDGKKDLYDFWGDRLYQQLVSEDRLIINLASKEYSKAVEKYLTLEDRFITVEFGQWVNGKVKQKATLAKMARGEMVRFLAENNVQDPEEIKNFQGLGFSYEEEASNDRKFTFITE